MVIIHMMLAPSLSEWILHTLLLVVHFLKIIKHLFTVSFTRMTPLVPSVYPKADSVLKNVTCAVHVVPQRLLGKAVPHKYTL